MDNYNWNYCYMFSRQKFHQSSYKHLSILTNKMGVNFNQIGVQFDFLHCSQKILSSDILGNVSTKSRISDMNILHSHRKQKLCKAVHPLAIWAKVYQIRVTLSYYAQSFSTFSSGSGMITDTWNFLLGCVGKSVWLKQGKTKCIEKNVFKYIK